MPVQQYQVFWTVPGAGPSVTTFHFQNVDSTRAAATADLVSDWFNSQQNYIPEDVLWEFGDEFAVLDTATGALTATIPVTPPAGSGGLVTGGWAAGAGYRIDWLTPFVREGRRVRGRTFMVPAGGNQFGADGQVSGSLRTAVTSASAAFLNGLVANTTPLAVYCRPRPGLPGQAYEPTSLQVPPLAATLRGRKY